MLTDQAPQSGGTKQVTAINLLAATTPIQQEGSLLARVGKISPDLLAELYREKLKAKGVKDADSYMDTKACLVGIRASVNKYNDFDDVMCLIYKEGSKYTKHDYTITTEPGSPKEPENEKNKIKRLSVISLGCYKFNLGIHKRSELTVYLEGGGSLQKIDAKIAIFNRKAYAALIQGEKIMPGKCDDMPYDGVLNANTEGRNINGINIHCAMYNPADHPDEASTAGVGGWSTGCQVFKFPKEYNAFLETCQEKNAPGDCVKLCSSKQRVLEDYRCAAGRAVGQPSGKKTTVTGKECYAAEGARLSCTIYYVLIDEKELFTQKINQVQTIQFYKAPSKNLLA